MHHLVGRASELVEHVFEGLEARLVGACLLEQALDLGTRSWGNDPNGTAVMLIGTYETQSEVGRRVLNALPALAVLDHATWESPLIPVLAQEIVKDEPGQEVASGRISREGFAA